MTKYNTGRPGVFIQEQALPQVVTLPDNGASIGALVGILPQGPDSVPVLLQSWTDFFKTFGPLSDAYPTTWAAFNFFANGGRSLYVKRVASDATAASITLNDASTSALPTLTLTAKNKGSWGNNLSVAITAGSASGAFNIIVYKTSVVAGRTVTSTAETWRDLRMSSVSPYYAVKLINTGSTLITAADLQSASTAPTNIPVAAAAAALSGGADADASPVRADYSESLSTFDPIDNPLVFNMPDAAYMYDINNPDSGKRLLSLQVQADAVEYAADRGDCFVIVDTPTDHSVEEAQAYISALSSAFAASTFGNCVSAYYPWIQVPDTTSAAPGALRAQAPGAAMIGQWLATDASRGVFKTPAGYGNRVALAVSTQSQLTNAELDSINTSVDPINAIRQVPGVGIVVMGGRTMDNTPGNRYINVRRSITYVEKELKRLSSFAVFENNDDRLWARLRASLGNFLMSYWQQGGLRGASAPQAFYVVCDSTNNSVTDIMNGTVNITVGVALEYPAEYVVITLGQITSNATA